MGISRWGAWIGVGMLAILALAACEPLAPVGAMAGGPTIWSNDLDHRRGTPHVEVYWTCKQTGSELRLDGLVGNPAQAGPVYYFEAELVGLDAGEKKVSDGRGQAQDDILRTGRSSPFGVTLQLSGRETRFDLFYDYRYNEGDHPNLVLAAAAPIGGLQLAQQTHDFMVVDACNPAKHKAR